MASFNKYDATLYAKRLMNAHVGTPNPRASRITPMLIFKHAIDHENFFTTIMPVLIEISFRRPSH
jgi:hypothetical protein